MWITVTSSNLKKAPKLKIVGGFFSAKKKLLDSPPFLRIRKKLGESSLFLDFIWRVLTVHVQLDGGGYGYGNVVVGGLASQNGMQVISLQILENEFVFRLERGLIVIGGVQECMISPPGHFGLRLTS